MKGIILAGGTGSRLHPLTIATSKQLLPVYDKPLIYYPLSTLMLAGIREIMVITTPHELEQFQRLLRDGSHFGLSISYAVQTQPNGIAEALLIGESFIGPDQVALILGDNIFFGSGMGRALSSKTNIVGASIFAYPVPNPEDFGVIELLGSGRVLSIEEKPSMPRSNLVVPGLYFYDTTAIERVKTLVPSPRGELEITDLHKSYLTDALLHAELLQDEVTWMDAGTVESLFEAARVVRAIQERENRKINVPEEIAFRLGYIDRDQLLFLAKNYEKSGYWSYLNGL